MGKVHSLVSINGKVGGYVFYELNGRPVVRKIAEKKKSTKTEGEKIVLRQNTEFGKASAAGKGLRIALAEECKDLADRYRYQRVAQLMLKLKSCDAAPPGSRTVSGGIATEEGGLLFCDFNFHKKQVSSPRLREATLQAGDLRLFINPAMKTDVAIIELQINFETGKFRRYVHYLSQDAAKDKPQLKKQFRRKKGFTDLVLISGEGFLQGVVVPMK